MKTNVSIKFNSIEEYREIEKKLEELGYVNDKEWNESMFIIKNINEGHIYISKVDFSVFSNKITEGKTYNSLEEFLND